MAAPSTSQNGRAVESSERTPLLPSGQSTARSSAEANSERPSRKSPDYQDHTAASQTITTLRGTLCTFGLGLVIFLHATNTSLLTTTQSAIANELDAFERVTWFTSAYLIAASALSPLNGKLASVFSPRICLFVSCVVLAIGCMVSSMAESFGVFILGRSITGIGASGIFTISMIVVLELTGSRRRGLALGLLNAGYTIGVAGGATLAGALLPVTGWRALFWMQAPISFFAGCILLFAIPQDFHAGKHYDSDHTTLKRLAKLDYLGALTLTTSIVLFLYALSSPKKIPLLPAGLSAIVLATFVLIEVHLAHDPIIPLTLLKSRGLLLTCLGTVGFMMARWSVLFYMPTYALAVRQWTPATAGSILIPTNGGFAVGGLMVGWLHIKRHGSFYFPTLVVYALFPVTLVALAFASTEYSSPWLVLTIVFACGALAGAAINYSLVHLLHLTPKSTHYIATSLVATFRGFAGSFGSAIGGGLFTRRLYQSLEDGFRDRGLTHKEDLVRRLLGSPALVENLEGMDKEVAIQGYQDALKMLYLAGAGLAALIVLVQAGTGWKAAEEESSNRLEEERQALVANQEDVHDDTRV